MVKTKLSSPDESGRQKVEEIVGSNYLVDADVVIMALGFDMCEYSFLASNGIETDKWGQILVDENYETTKTGIYAGGDCHRGADLVVTAVRDGREAAKAIIRKLLA